MPHSWSFSQLGLAGLLGVICVDLTQDFAHGDDAITIAYYTGMRAAKPPVALAVPALILVALLPLLARIFTGRSNWADKLTGLLGAPALYLFVGVLIPTQEAIMHKQPKDTGVREALDTIALAHVASLVLVLAQIGLQVVAQPVGVGVAGKRD